MRSRRKGFVILVPVVAATLVSVVAPAPASDSTYLKLKDSRDALLIQQREVQRSYNEMQAQIDELRRRQALLEAYLHQLDRSVRDVDGALAQLH